MNADFSHVFTEDAANRKDQHLDHSASLDQLSDEDFWRRARTLARQGSSSAEAHEYLECELSRYRCVLPLDALREVCLPPDHYACLPALPWWACGLVAWHGEVICVIDLDRYLSTQASEQGQIERDESPLAGMLLVALHHAIPIGLHVRSIGRTRTIEPDAVVGAEANIASWIDQSRAALVAGTLDDAVILDLPALLADVMDALEATIKGGSS